MSVGTIGTGQCGSSGDEYLTLHGPHIDLAEYHDYGEPRAAIPGDRWNGLARRIQQSASLDKPLFVGEVGITTSDAGSTLERSRLLDAKLRAQSAAGVVGGLIWSWRAADRGLSPGLTGT